MIHKEVKNLVCITIENPNRTLSKYIILFSAFDHN